MLYAEINKTYGVHIGDPLLEQIKQNISSLLKSLSATPTVQRVIATYLTLGLTAKEAALITGLIPRQIYRMRNNLDSYDLSSLKFSVSNLIIFCNVVHLI
jgi:GGDEF domain-containing protein